MLHLRRGDAAARGPTSTSRSTRRSGAGSSRASTGPGEKLSLHELAAELGVSRSPVHHALTRLVSEGCSPSRRGVATSSRPSRAGRSSRATTSGSRSSLHAADVAVDTAVGRADRGAAGATRRDGRRDLARGVGHRERRLPRDAGRPRGQPAPLALLPRALGQPDDAGDPRRAARARRVPRDGAPSDRRGARGARPRAARAASPARRVRAASRSTRSSAPAARSDATPRTGRAARRPLTVRPAAPAEPRVPAGAPHRIDRWRSRPTDARPNRASR